MTKKLIYVYILYMYNFVPRKRLFDLTKGRNKFNPNITDGLVLHFDFSDKNTLQLDESKRVISASETKFGGNK